MPECLLPSLALAVCQPSAPVPPSSWGNAWALSSSSWECAVPDGHGHTPQTICTACGYYDPKVKFRSLLPKKPKDGEEGLGSESKIWHKLPGACWSGMRQWSFQDKSGLVPSRQSREADQGGGVLMWMWSGRHVEIQGHQNWTSSEGFSCPGVPNARCLPACSRMAWKFSLKSRLLNFTFRDSK